MSSCLGVVLEPVPSRPPLPLFFHSYSAFVLLVVEEEIGYLFDGSL